jgi:phosphatidylglycerol---prolipoprotein diacylglyceryl transferase
MHPVLFNIGSFSIYSYGVMVALGFGIAAYFIYSRAASFELNKDKMIDMLIMILLGGLLGARALYVILNLGYYAANPLEVFYLSKGGLVWYGAFFAGIAIAVWYIIKNGFNFWLVTDLMVPYVAMAQSLGRVGCFLNGCCYGSPAPAGYPLAVMFPDSCVARYPTELFSAVALLAIFIILRVWQDLPHFKGEIFLGYCLLYSLKRFVVEFFRGDNPKIIASLTLSQSISAVIFISAAAVFIYKDIQWRRYLKSK